MMLMAMCVLNELPMMVAVMVADYVYVCAVCAGGADCYDVGADCGGVYDDVY